MYLKSQDSAKSCCIFADQIKIFNNDSRTKRGEPKAVVRLYQ